MIQILFKKHFMKGLFVKRQNSRHRNSPKIIEDFACNKHNLHDYRNKQAGVYEFLPSIKSIFTDKGPLSSIIRLSETNI